MKISLEITKIIGISESPKLHKFFIFLSQQTNCTVIILDFTTDCAEDAVRTEKWVSGSCDNIPIATPGARSKVELPSFHLRTLIHAHYFTDES